MINIAINGFGRIGRNFLRAILQDSDALKKLKISVINVGPANLDAVAHMFKYDSVMGTYLADVQVKGDFLDVDGYKIKILSETDPKNISWSNFDIDWVVDVSGRFTEGQKAQMHIDSGAKKVLISAPAKGEDVTIIPGVNDDDFNKNNHKIVALGSCTTNAIVPVLKVLHDAFGIKSGFMTTIHAYTNTQVLLDVEHTDLRRARAAAINIIPTTTGATKVLGKIIPELDGLIRGRAIRVPVAKVSIIDLSFVASEELSAKKINDAFLQASKGHMKGILDISDEPLVSSDYSGNNFSVVVDGLLTDAIGNTGKVFGWYDNEWGYSVRLKDFLLRACTKTPTILNN